MAKKPTPKVKVNPLYNTSAITKGVADVYKTVTNNKLKKRIKK